MIKNLFFKNMTIVECVIFLTSIVILISALLPGRDEVEARSALAADQITITNMNTPLSEQDPPPDTLTEVIAALEIAGFDIKDGIVPASKDCIFVWGKNEQAILLVKLTGESQKILYPKKYVDVQYDPTKHFDLSINDT